MDKLNEILKNSKMSATASKPAEALNALTKKDLLKFVSENKLPRYLLYGLILVKSAMIYDKLRQVVAINSVYEQIVRDEGKVMREQFRDEAVVQDVLTRRLLEARQFVEDEEELERGARNTPAYRKSI